MATPFFRTTRAVETDGATRRWWSLGLVLALLVGWAGWFFFVPVAVYETSQSARLEADRAIHPIESAVAGRVVAINLKLNAVVEVGAILVELDSETQRRRLDQEKRQLEGLSPQRDALKRQIAAEEDAIKRSRVASRSASDEARARRAEADTASTFAADESARLTKIGDKLPELDVLRARAEADKRRANAQALGINIQRVENDQLTKESQARAHIEELRRDLASLESDINTTTASIAVLAQEIERRTLRAPVAGRIGAVTQSLQVGVFIKEGEPLGSIVPAGALHIAAEFLPQDATGRIHEGQPARLRLNGFPWTQFGSVIGRVATLEAEPREGRVRVELAVVSVPPAVPMQHGLPGTLEVEVERVTPATLVLRACGRIVSSPSGRP